MASASYRLRSEPPADRWSDETSADEEIHPVDLDQQDGRLKRLSRRKRSSHPFPRCLSRSGVGLTCTPGSRSYGDMARDTIATAYPQRAWLAPPPGSLAQAAPEAVAPAEPATPSPDQQ